MKKDLINRYVFAVSRHLPKDSKEEISKEILSLIYEMIAQSVNHTDPTEEDIIHVLEKLGNPDKLALKYMGKEDVSLISGTSLLLYKRLLILILPIVAVSIIGLFILTALLEGDPHVFASLDGALVSILSTTFTIITIIMAITEKCKKKDKDDFINSLPVSPQEKKRISLLEPISHIIAVILFASFLLFFPQLISGKPSGFVERIPFFDVVSIRNLWYIVGSFVVIDMAIQIFKIYEKKYTKRLVLINCIGNVLMLIIITVLFANKSIINSDFINLVATKEHTGEVGSKVLKTLHWQILSWIYLIMILDIISVIKNGLKKCVSLDCACELISEENHFN